ncbi:MAG: hypothetical protein ACXWWA_07340 [Chitinophagaceae bacterium]
MFIGSKTVFLSRNLYIATLIEKVVFTDRHIISSFTAVDFIAATSIIITTTTIR